MSLDKSLKNLKYDVRMQEFNLNNGVINETELKSHLTQLPDNADQAVKLEIEDQQSASQQH